MTCPKCDSTNVIAAPDEAPPRARQWMKCWACGNRWDHAGAMPTTDDDENDAEQDDESMDPPPVRRKRTVDEVMDLVMSQVRAHREKQKEDEMPKFVSEEHRQRWIQGQREAREAKKKLAAGGGDASDETKTPARRGRPPKVKTSLPAVRSAHVVDAVPVSSGELDSALIALEADRATLERAKQILERIRG